MSEMYTCTHVQIVMSDSQKPANKLEYVRKPQLMAEKVRLTFPDVIQAGCCISSDDPSTLLSPQS